MVAQADAAERALADLAGTEARHPVRDGEPDHRQLLAAAKLVAFRAMHHHVAVKALIGNTAEVAQAVAEGKVEIGLVEGAVHDPVLEQTLVGRDRLVIVAPPHHPWTRKPPRPVRSHERKMGAARAGLGHAFGLRGGDRRQGRGCEPPER